MLNDKNEKLIGIFESFFEINEKEEFFENLNLFYKAESQSEFKYKIH